MRYLYQRKSGIWCFRYQIPVRYRNLFDQKREIKKSLRTKDKEQAHVLSLNLLFEIKSKLAGIHSNTDLIRLSSQQPPTSFNGQPNIASTPSNSITVDKIASEYRAEKQNKGVGEKSVQATINAFCVMHELIEKKSLGEVNRATANTAYSLVKKLPADRFHAKHAGEFLNMSCLKAIEANNRVNAPAISNYSANRYVERTSSVYEWCKKHNYIDYNPWRGLASKRDDTVKDSERRKAFSEKDLITIFSHRVYQTGEVGLNNRTKQRLYYQYWIPLIALYSGMRMNEICQLYRADINKIDNIWCFHVRDDRENQKLKNKNSRRLVPIHSYLISLGFIDFISNISGEDRIFSELSFSNSDGYTKSLSSWFTKNLINANNFGKQRKTFYSFRHTFINYFKQNSSDIQTVASIVGHLNNGITYDVYGDSVSIIRQKSEIEKLSYPSVEKLLYKSIC